MNPAMKRKRESDHDDGDDDGTNKVRSKARKIDGKIDNKKLTATEELLMVHHDVIRAWTGNITLRWETLARVNCLHNDNIFEAALPLDVVCYLDSSNSSNSSKTSSSSNSSSSSNLVNNQTPAPAPAPEAEPSSEPPCALPCALCAPSSSAITPRDSNHYLIATIDRNPAFSSSSPTTSTRYRVVAINGKDYNGEKEGEKKQEGDKYFKYNVFFYHGRKDDALSDLWIMETTYEKYSDFPEAIGHSIDIFNEDIVKMIWNGLRAVMEARDVLLSLKWDDKDKWHDRDEESGESGESNVRCSMSSRMSSRMSLPVSMPVELISIILSNLLPSKISVIWK